MGHSKKVEGALPCLMPGCEVTFSSVKNLKNHLKSQHNKKMLTKQIREELDNMAGKDKVAAEPQKNTSEEITPVVVLPEDKGQPQNGLTDSELGNKVDLLLQRIPEDFCSQFPHLCRLGSKMDELEGTMKQLQKAVPTSISVKIPKMPEPVEPEKIDLDGFKAQLGAEFSKILGEAGKADKELLQQVLDAKFQQFAEKLQPKEATPPPKPSPTPAEEKPPTKALPENGDKHASFEELYNCPECRTKLLNELAAKIRGGEDTSVELNGFLNTILPREGEIKNGTTDEKQGKPGSSTGSDLSTGTADRGTDGPHTELDGGTAQPGAHDAGASGSDIASDDSKCIGPFCLFTHRRPSQA